MRKVWLVAILGGAFIAYGLSMLGLAALLRAALTEWGYWAGIAWIAAFLLLYRYLDYRRGVRRWTDYAFVQVWRGRWRHARGRGDLDPRDKFALHLCGKLLCRKT